jgi:hypothetical protein
VAGVNVKGRAFISLTNFSIMPRLRRMLPAGRPGVVTWLGPFGILRIVLPADAERVIRQMELLAPCNAFPDSTQICTLQKPC